MKDTSRKKRKQNGDFWIYNCHVTLPNKEKLDKELKANPKTKTGWNNSFNRIINKSLEFYFKHKDKINPNESEMQP